MIQTRQVNVERWSVTSTESFETILARMEREIGRPEMSVFWQKAASAGTLAELEGVVNDSIGPAGLMEFVRFDHGGIVRKVPGPNRAKTVAGYSWTVRNVIAVRLRMHRRSAHPTRSTAYLISRSVGSSC